MRYEVRVGTEFDHPVGIKASVHVRVSEVPAAEPRFRTLGKGLFFAFGGVVLVLVLPCAMYGLMTGDYSLLRGVAHQFAQAASAVLGFVIETVRG
jgi:hypothetical protein